VVVRFFSVCEVTLQLNMPLIEQRMNIKSCVLLQKSPAETLTMLQQVYDDREMKKSQVYDWHKHFCDGLESVDSDLFSGRPSVSSNEANVERV
jgi:hypothetical protein